jgi:hypothetical protein
VRGKPLSRAVRSHGSMLLLDFGRLRKVPGLRKRYHLHGEWTLIVEWSDWTIMMPGSPRVADRSDYALIDDTLPRLVKQPVQDLAFNMSGRIAVRLQNGMSFVATGKGGPHRSPLSLWFLLSDHHWSVTFTCSRRFVVHPDSRVA